MSWWRGGGQAPQQERSREKEEIPGVSPPGGSDPLRLSRTVGKAGVQR